MEARNLRFTGIFADATWNWWKLTGRNRRMVGVEKAPGMGTGGCERSEK